MVTKPSVGRRPFDFELEPGVWFGPWLLRELKASVPFEEDPFWIDYVGTPSRTLQAHRAPHWRFEVQVPWLKSQTAFIAPGRNIYFGRRLLERMPSEESVAFVIAHEIGHQDLEHLTFLQDWHQRMGSPRLRTWGAVAFHHILQRAYGPEQELDADRFAIDLCMEVGYAPEKCLRAFDVMRHMSLEWGDIDGVFGHDVGFSDRLNWLNRTKMWVWQRSRGYLPVNERQKRLADHIRARRG